jgi:hypothetical protein
VITAWLLSCFNLELCTLSPLIMNKAEHLLLNVKKKVVIAVLGA